MTEPFHSSYRIITVSGSLGVGTSTLAKKIRDTIHWKYVNAGEIQRKYDETQGLVTNRDSSLSRSDAHEREIEAMTTNMLKTGKHLVYEAWLAGFMAREMKDVLKVLLVCSNEAVRIDRIMNRDDMTIEEAKKYVRVREEGNIQKWRALYGDYDFWDPSYFDLVIDTYSKGPMQTLGLVLDKLGYT
jgi:predicted cytidylate kinase